MNGDERRKIVMADDSRELCELVKTALEREGYAVDTVYDGMELLSYLRDNQDIDAIILDLIMPVRGGISVYETVRSISPASKLLIYSGHTDYKDSVYGREADAFIEKTQGVEEILRVLKAIL